MHLLNEQFIDFKESDEAKASVLEFAEQCYQSEFQWKKREKKSMGNSLRELEEKRKIASYVNKEIKRALSREEYFAEGTRFIMPVQIEACTLVDKLSHRQTADEKCSVGNTTAYFLFHWVS